MPALGAITILLTLATAFIARHNTSRMSILIAASIFFIISDVITSRVNMPLNRNVIPWSSSAPPSNWTESRDTWWRWHRFRAASGAAGLALLIVAALLRNSEAMRTISHVSFVRPLLNAFIQAMSLLL